MVPAASGVAPSVAPEANVVRSIDAAKGVVDTDCGCSDGDACGEHNAIGVGARQLSPMPVTNACPAAHGVFRAKQVDGCTRNTILQIALWPVSTHRTPCT